MSYKVKQRGLSLLVVSALTFSLVSNVFAATVKTTAPAVPAANGKSTPTADSCGYPNNSKLPKSATLFNESTITRSAAVFGFGLDATIGIFANDEKAALLGVSSGAGTPVSLNTTSPQHVSSPALGDQSLQDPSLRPFFPALFITDITGGASTAGDWQQGGSPVTHVDDVFGTWSTAKLVGSTFTDTIPPAKNHWNLGAGADTPPAGTTSFDEGYGAEFRWNASGLQSGGKNLQPGHTYRFQILAHDGDQNKDGGDAGEQCVNLRIPLPPAVDLVKSVTPGTLPEPGGDFHFTLSIHNLSEGPVKITTLTDDNTPALSASCLALIGQTLAADQTKTCTYTIAHSAIGKYDNTADVTVTDGFGKTASDEDKASVTVTDVLPTVTLDKSVDVHSMPEPGGTFHYTLKITNTSAEPVKITALTDDNALSQACKDLVGTTLAIGAWVSCTYDVSHGDVGVFPNKAEVTVQDDEKNTAKAHDNESVAVTDVKPVISVDKTADPIVLDEPGGKVTFTVAVKNKSVEIVSLDSLVDDVHGNLDGQGTCVADGSVKIAAGGTYTCTFPANVTGNANYVEKDTVTGHASDNEGNDASDSDSAEVTILNVDPTVTVIKDATPATLPEPGGTFTFNVTVHNGSFEDVTLVALSDDTYPDMLKQGDCELGGVIPAGGDYKCSFSGDFFGDANDEQTDVVTATIRDNDEVEKSNFDDATVGLTDVLPTIDVTKDVSSESASVGDTVTFTVSVKNTSAETVWLTKLTDSIYLDLNGVGDCVADGTVSILAGATYTCSFDEIVTKTETDVVTAHVIDNEKNPAEGDDDATVTVNPAAIAIDKTADHASVNAGDKIGFSVKVSNNGSGTAKGVIVTDTLPTTAGLAWILDDNAGGKCELAAGVVTCTVATLDVGDAFAFTFHVTSTTTAKTAANSPVENTACVKTSNDGEGCDTAHTDVLAIVVKGETAPPTDVLVAPEGTNGPGSSLMLILALFGLLVIGIAIINPIPAAARRRNHR